MDRLLFFCLAPLLLPVWLFGGEVTLVPKPLPERRPIVFSADTEGKGEVLFYCNDKGSGGAAIPVTVSTGNIEAAVEPGGLLVYQWRSGGTLVRRGVQIVESGRRLAVKGVGLRNLRIRNAEPPNFGDDFMRPRSAEAAFVWDVAEGELRLAAAARPEFAVSPFHAVLVPAKDGRFRALFSRDDALRYAAGFSFEYKPGAEVGLGAYRRGESGYLLLLNGSEARLLFEEEGAARVLATAALQLVPGWHQVVLGVEKEHITALVDMKPVLSAGRVWLPGGRAMVSIRGGSLRVDDVFVVPLEGSVRDTAAWWWGRLNEIPDVFRKDPGMEQWARITGLFRADREHRDIRAVFPLFPPFRLEFPLDFKPGGWLDAGTAERPGFWKKIATTEAKSAKVVLEAEDSGPLSLSLDGEKQGRSLRVGGAFVLPQMAGPLARSAASSFSLVSPNFRDFTFFRQPVLWQPLSGHWYENSLWACNPSFSWFRGDALSFRRAAAVHFRESVGRDFRIRLTCAIPMLGDQAPYYEFPTNVGVALVDAEGKRVDAVFGLYDVPSLIAVDGRPVAEADYMVNPAVRMMFSVLKDALHLAWISLEVEHLEGRMRIYHDSRRLAEAEVDLKPPVSLSLFTVDNGVVLARAEISSPLGPGAAPAEPRTEEWRRLVYKARPELDRMQAFLAGREAAAGTARWLARSGSAARVGPGRRRVLYWDFEEVPSAGVCGYDGCEFMQGEDAPRLTDKDWKGYSAYSGGKHLVAVNRRVGGLLVPLVNEPFDIRDYPELRFSYRIPPRSRPALIALIERRPAQAALVYQRANVLQFNLQNDGDWHRAKIDLLTLASAARLPRDRRLVCSYIGLHDVAWPEHCRADWVALDDLYLVPAVTRAETTTGVMRTLDRTWPVVSASRRGGDGGDKPPVELSFEGDAFPESALLKLRGDVPLETVGLSFEKPGGAEPLIEYRFGHASLELTNDGLRWQLPRGYELPHGELNIVARALDGDGNPVEVRRQLNVEPAQDKAGPRLEEADVHVRFASGLTHASFDSPDDWGEVSSRGGLFLLPDPEDCGFSCAAYRGDFNHWESFVFLRRAPFDVDEFPYLRFRYRLRKGLRGWLGARVGREVLAIFDTYNHRGREVQERTQMDSDARWHTMVVDLRRILKEYLFENDEGRRIVEQVFTNTPYWRTGNADRLIYLDEVSLYSEKPQKLTVEVAPLRDGGGFGGLAWSIDNDARAEAPGKPNSEKSAFEVDNPAERGKFLHLRAFDGRGNAGNSVTVPLFP